MLSIVGLGGDRRLAITSIPEYGTDDDLKEFIAEAHKLDMRVPLDMVYLHCGPNATEARRRSK